MERDEVFERIDCFLDGQVTLREFEDWLVEYSWNMHRDSSPEAQQLVWSIELELAEHSSGHRSVDELKASLRDMYREAR